MTRPELGRAARARDDGSGMATLLIGYDTESAAVGEGLARFLGPDVPQYRAALDPDTTRRGVALLARLPEELEAPCTFFVCGRTTRSSPSPARSSTTSSSTPIAMSCSATFATGPREAAPRRCCRRRRTLRCARSSRSPPG